MEIDSRDVPENGDDGEDFRLPQLISEFRAEREQVRSLQFQCRARIVRSLVSSGGATSLKAAVDRLKSGASLPATIADFLLLENTTSIKNITLSDFPHL